MNKKRLKRESEQIVNLLFHRNENIASGASADCAPASVAAAFDGSEDADKSSDSESSGSEFSQTTSDDYAVPGDDLRQNLAEWSIKHNITTAATDDLLKILGRHVPGLPLCARTLKNTPKETPKVTMGSGEYIRYGVQNALTNFLLQTEFSNNRLDLNINIDGLPLAKSSNIQIWPILVNVQESEDVRVIGAYCGNSKSASANDFLKSFIDELLLLMENGLLFNGKQYAVSCRAFICDAPISSFLSSIYSSFCMLQNRQYLLFRKNNKDFNFIFNNTVDDTPITKKDLQVFEKNVLEHIKKSEEKILKEIEHKKSLTRILQETKQRSQGQKVQRNEVLPKKPFDNLDEFKNFEKEIQESNRKYESLAVELSHLISSSGEKFIKNAWRKILSDGAAQHLCWKGTNQKMAVRALSVTAALKSSCSAKFPQTTDTEFERTTIAYFQQAKGRFTKRRNYKNKTVDKAVEADN